MRKILSFIVLFAIGFVLIACGKTTYTVTFESNGGGSVSQAVVEENKKLPEPTAPAKTGFVFDGWFKESALTNEWNFDTDVVTANITLYAKWLTSDQGLVDGVYDWLNLGDLTNLTNQSARLILPTTRDGVTIVWSIDKTEYVALNGLITQPEHEDGNQTVTLTATLIRGVVTRIKTFTATVIALPSVEDTEPLIDEDFTSYTDGNILDQTGIWGPVSGKSGTSLFTVISSLTPAIPGGSKALKIEALTELQIEAPIVHTYDLVVIEVDLLQTTTSNGSAVNIQSSSSSPVVGFGLDGASLFYRTDNGELHKTEININQWYTLRVEIDLTNKTLEAFYYEDGQLIAITPGKVTFTGTTALQSLFIRSGSSTTTVLRAPAYVTNLVANRIEALPRPVEEIKLGEVTDVPATVSIEEGTTFTPSTPKVYNKYGSRQLLTVTTDYTVAVTNPVDINTPGEYTVTYTITNVDNTADVKVVTQTATVYSTAEPNEITSVTSSLVGYIEKLTDISIEVVQPSGTLYYLLSSNATETKASILLGSSILITNQSIKIDDIAVGNNTHVHFFVDLNGDSNIYSHALTKEAVTLISSASEFVSIFSSTATEITGSFALVSDIDLEGIVWADGNTSFKGKLYGNNHIISNLSMTKSGTNYGGLFARVNGGLIRDLVLDNIQVNSADRGGILVGRIENTISTIDNIVIMNSSITAANSNGVGGVIGLVSKDTYLTNVTILDSDVFASGVKNVGGVVGRVDGGTLFASDIYVRGVEVKSNVLDALDIAAGAFVGYVRDSVASIVTANRIIIVDTQVNAQVGGALIGYLRSPGNATIQNAYVDVDFTHASTVSAGLVGRVNNEVDKLSETTIFGTITGSIEHAQTQNLTNSAIPSDLTWWSTNLTSFTSSSLWTLESTNIFALNNYIENSSPMINITLDYNFDVANEVVEIRQNQVFNHTAPSVAGLNFVGWFTNSEMTTALPVDYKITVAVTLYGKYEEVPASQVTFVTNVDGLTVPMQEVNYNQLATAPVVADTMIGGVLKKVTGWTLGGAPFAFTTPITANTELVAVWETVSYTVTFNGGNAVDVLYGELVTAPTEVPTHYFTEVTFKEWQLAGVAYNFTTPVTSNLALVAAFNDPVSISIDTVEEFYHMVTVESTWNYVLSTDLDFTSFTWTYVNTAFKGSLDGQGHTVSHITLTGLTGYAGLFPRTNGATIKNLVIDDITIQTSERAGGLVGRVENGDTVIENIMIINSSIEGGNSNGVGGLIGLVSRKTDVKNIAIINTTVKNSAANVGGLVGRVDSAPMNAEDIFISGVTVTSTSANTSDVAASAVVGYVRDNVNSVFNGLRIVVLDTTVDGNVAAAFVGYNRHPGTSTLLNAYFEVEFVNNERSGFIGYNRDQVVAIDQSTIFGKITNDTPHSQAVSLTNSVDVQDHAWWNTHLNSIVTSPLWDMNDGRSYGLKLYTDTLPPLRVVTIDFNTSHDSITQSYREGMLFNQNSPVLLGYNFLGWFSNEALTTALSSPYVVNADVTIYAKYEAVPPSQVSFVTNVDGLTVPTQDVNYGLLATLPVVANQTIEGVLKEVIGWTLNGNPFTFDTPITASIELVAVWSPVTYTVTFDGKNPVEVLHNELVIEPTEDPVHIFSERIFVEWRLAGVAYDFNTPVTSDLSLVSAFADPVGDIMISTVEEFYYMATVESTYSYKLANDLDFASYSWTYVNTSFKGTFDGQGHTISYITMTGLTNYGGVFPRANGATIQNLVLDHITISTTARAGILVGRIENTASVIENIVIKNSSVSGGDSNGVGGVVGQISKSTNMFNIAVVNTTISNSVVNVGGLVGRIDGGAVVYADDIFVSGATITSLSTNTSDVAASALIGYIANVTGSTYSGVRVVIWNTTVDGNVAAAFVGYNRYPGTADLQDAYIKVTFVNNEKSGLIGYNRDQVVVLDQTSIFGSLANDTPNAQAVSLTNVAVPSDAAWWTTNLNNIATSSTWVVNSDGSVTLALLVP